MYNYIDTISVIIPTYNREKTIEYCIKSIINQTLKPFEIIIVDDCSDDKTIEIVEKMNINNLKIIKLEKNSGAQVARNTGVLESTGKWIAFQDSDDEWILTRLERTLEKANKYGYDMVYSQCIVKNHQNDKEYILKLKNIEGDSYNKLLKYQAPMFQSMLIKRECFINHKILDANVVAYQEWDTSINISKYYKIGFIEEPLFIYHLHDGETISKNSVKGAQGYEYIINKNKEDILKNIGKEGLLKHYNNLIKLYEKANAIDKSKEYEIKAVNLKYNIKKENSNYIFENEELKLINRLKKYYLLCNKWIKCLNNNNNIKDYFKKHKYKNIYVYGSGELAERVLESISDLNVLGIVVEDKSMETKFDNYKYYDLNEFKGNSEDVIIITPIYAFNEIKLNLKNFKGEIISLETVIDELENKYC